MCLVCFMCVGLVLLFSAWLSVGLHRSKALFIFHAFFSSERHWSMSLVEIVIPLHGIDIEPGSFTKLIQFFMPEPINTHDILSTFFGCDRDHFNTRAKTSITCKVAYIADTETDFELWIHHMNISESLPFALVRQSRCDNKWIANYVW